ncbi:MAG TPA: DUF3574 domain-containing protein [Stellaceae bacterium]|nr:DUF3574 domain-containing protein [Stellaceae bacterium]
MRGRVAAALLLGPLCAGNGPTPAQAAEPTAASCPLPGQERMIVAELFFGREKTGNRVVSDAAWSDFLATVVTPNFPDGLTVFDGYGQWRNPQSGVIGRSEGVKIVLIAAKPGADVAGRLQSVIAAYKARFQQQSVGIITRDSCAAF